MNNAELDPWYWLNMNTEWKSVMNINIVIAIILVSATGRVPIVVVIISAMISSALQFHFE